MQDINTNTNTDTDADSNTDDGAGASPAQEPERYAPVEALVTNTGAEWRMPADLYDEYCRNYPGVDVAKEVRMMRMWLITNSTKRKTARGMPRFVNSWLAREQDRGWRRADRGKDDAQAAGAGGIGDASSIDDINEFFHTNLPDDV